MAEVTDLHRQKEAVDSVSVAVGRGSATFKRTGARTAELTVDDHTPDLQVAVETGVPEAVEALCRAEIEMHVETFRELHAALMQSLSHEGIGLTSRTDSKWSFRRSWWVGNGAVEVVGGEFRTQSAMQTDNEKTADAALASAELQNILKARVEGIQSLYANISSEAVHAGYTQ